MSRQKSPRRLARQLFGAVGGLAVLGTAAIYLLGTYQAQYQSGESLKIQFETGENPGYSSWALLGHLNEYVLQICCEHSYKQIPDPEGMRGNVGQFSLRPTDSKVKGNYRSELRILSNPLGQDSWYRASIYIPSDWKESNVKVVAMQWHGSRDFFLGEVGRMPPLEITITQDKWQVQKAYDNRLISTSDTPGHVEKIVLLTELNIQKGAWTDWVVRTRWSSKDDGITQVWMNGNQIVEDFGPNAHKDLTGPYLKAGVYAPEWGYSGTEPDISERTLLFDQIEMIQAEDPFDILKLAAR